MKTGRPPLRLLDGLREQADNANIELSVRLSEDRAHARRMRLVMQTRLFTDPAFDYLTRPLVRELEKFERQIAEQPERVA